VSKLVLRRIIANAGNNGILIPLRKQLYKISGIKMGKRVNIDPQTEISDPRKISIGDFTRIGPRNIFHSRGGIKIGRNVLISGYSLFETQTHNYNSPQFDNHYAPIIIKDNVWIATGATLISGFKPLIINEGAVIGAKSVITKNVEPYTVMAGSPAKFIKKRQKKIKYLLNNYSIPSHYKSL